MNQYFRNSIFFIGLIVSLIGFAYAKTNFVIFLADDLGYGDVGYQGGDVSTPNIDSIANEGVSFTDGYVSCPVCAPSRAGLLTGRYQNTFGFWDNICLLYTSPSPRDRQKSRMPSSA